MVSTAFKDSHYIQPPEVFNYAHELKKPWGTLDSILAWNKKSLSGKWKWQLVEQSSDRAPGRYIFFFNNERDFLAFLLKWS